jgi:glycosyltransferase involved in cell wall biosynthesis
MKILIIASYNTGKFSAFVTEQAKDLRNLGLEIDYFGVEGKGMRGYLKNRKPLLQKIKEFKPDVIHAHYGLCGALAVLQKKVPVVITFHDGETYSDAKIVNIISSLASLFAAHTIYVAKHIYDLSYLKSKRKYSIIPCGVNVNDCKIIEKEKIRTELNFSPNMKYVLFGGAFDNLRKGYPLLKEAVGLLDRKNIEIIEMKGLNRDQITKLMCACDLFALPTKREGSPQALKEAMSCNCPIIATDVADIKWLLGNLNGHYLCTFDPRNIASKISEAFIFHGRTDGRKRISELGLDSETVAKKVLNIYKSILKVK